MSNAVYTQFKTGLTNAEYDLNTGVLKVALVRGYTFSAAHATMADVTAAGGVVNGTGTLANVTVTAGVVDADDTTITTSSNNTAHVLVLYQASGPAGGADVSSDQQKLIAYYDTGSGLPIQPGNGTLTVTWPNTANKIIKVG